MKKKFLSMTMLVLAFVGNAQAQEDYDAFEFFYQPVVLSSNYTPIQGDFKTHGFAIGYQHGWCLNEKVPFYFSSGLRFQYLYARRSRPYSFGPYGYPPHYIDAAIQNDVDILHFQIPLTLSFNWNISETFGIEPFAGFDLSAYPFARLRYAYDFWEGGTHYYGAEKLNMLSDGDMSSIEYEEDGQTKQMVGANWFQVGWHAGIKFRIAMISITAEYGQDFTNFFPDSKWRRSSISIGFCF